MKTMTCKQMGGMCDASMTAATQDEMMTMGMKHLEEAHPEMAADVKKMAPTDPMMMKWQDDFNKTWAATPNN